MNTQNQPIEFVKVEATGNDFILAEANMVASDARPSWVKQACDRHFGIGADGVIFTEAAGTADFGWQFYNSDGSRAEMCGNAARAVSLVMSQKLNKSELVFETQIGIVKAQISSPKAIEVSWQVKSDLSSIKESIQTPGVLILNTGVPHAVIEMREYAPSKMKVTALNVKERDEFAKDGTNVTFFRRIDRQTIESWTFERGVDEFTLSCGTGAIASAAVALASPPLSLVDSPNQREDKWTEVRVTGGVLFVKISGSTVTLKGPASVVAKATWLKEPE